MRSMKLVSLSTTTLMLALAASSSACSGAAAETTADDEQAILCLPDTDPSVHCKAPPPRKLPPVSYLTVTTTETTATVAFLTQNGPVSATVTIGPGTAVGVGALPPQSDGSTVDHSFTFSGLRACSDYWYEVAFGGGIKASGTFSTKSATMSAVDVTRIAYDHVQLHVHTSSPAAPRASIHQAQAIQTDSDWDAPMSDPGALDHYYSFALNGPRYDVTVRGCGGSPTAAIRIDDWPASYGATYEIASTGLDYPSSSTMYWTTDGEVQGVAHDDASNWLVSNKFYIIKVPVTHDLNDHGARYPSGTIPLPLFNAGYQHIGDIDFASGFTYAPLEHEHGGAPMVLVYDRDLHVVLQTVISAGATTEVPWVAINPIDGLLYTSVFDINGDKGRGLRRFRIARDAAGRPISLTLVDEVFIRDGNGVPVGLKRIQGGVFSPMGHLYLVSDADSSDGGQGIYGIDIDRMQIASYRFIDYKPDDHDGVGFEELEGIDLWDRSDGLAPGIGGQLHVMMGNWNNSMWFKHYEVRGTGGAPSPAGVWAL